MPSTINADNGVVSGSSGVKTTADTSGVLALQSNGSTGISLGTDLVTTLTNPLPVGSGGTGATSLSGITSGSATNLAGGVAGAVPYQSGVGATGFSAAGTSGQVLTSAGTSVPTWTAQSSLAVGSATSATTATTATSATTATNIAGGSNGTIPYQSAAGTTQMLAVGTAGQVLQTNGAGAPTWVTPGGGSLILVQSVDGTGVDTVDLTGSFSSTYDFYKLYVSFNGTTNENLYLRMFIDGTLYTATNYAYTSSYAAPGQSNWPVSYSSAGSQSYLNTYISGKSLQFELTFFQPSNDTNRCSTWWLGNSADGPPSQTVYGTGSVVATGTAGTREVTGIRLSTFGGTGNWAARLYGIKKT